MKYKTGIGQDSHAFLQGKSSKKCVLAGLIFEDVHGLQADSDGDVIFHSICNAISSLTHVPILGKVATDLCHKEGITDSLVYLQKAMETLGSKKIEHVALTVEALRPKFLSRMFEIRKSIATAMHLAIDQVGITFTTGEGLTAFGRGEAVQCFCILTVSEEETAGPSSLPSDPNLAFLS
jgi:2-C-methyl-D-erythritol 2,4-cyclodiphosphate synthase